MKHLYKKELGYYLNNPIGYIIISLFAVFANFLFVKDIFVVGSASMRPFFSLLPWLMLVFIPALSMRIFAEEKRTNTIEVLLSLPVSEVDVVLAKFFALITLVAISLVLTVGLPVSMTTLTKIYLPEVFIGYCGVLLLGSFYIAIGIFYSSLTKNQVVAYLSSVLTIFIFLVLATDFTASILPKFIQDFLNYFSPLPHLLNFIKGVVDLRSVFYYISAIALFLFFGVIQIGKRN